ncbi:hypothetical protein RUMHYD_00531 [Blautia hydrogenotrophica DSM 10507]|uniref:Uncharacterized protein n=1 Tax=Blautia hydrogenotrophica (strain DSM 10507 / JCM 14656 / S5a33) TaxID=476272 RepID=C0CI67_BLAHS|nr:hypothetical protein RUMHYD_00531 [Blautia hydrogenotrophica DSM 10507]
MASGCKNLACLILPNYQTSFLFPWIYYTTFSTKNHYFFLRFWYIIKYNFRRRRKV